MKKLLFILGVSFYSVCSYSQTYTPMSFEDYMAPLVAYKQAFDKANNEIRSVETIIMNALGNDIDDTLREQLNSDYNRLSRISQTLNGSGMYGGIWNDINNVRTSVNSHINSYNSRVAALRRQQAALEEARRQEEIQRQDEQTRLAREAGWTGTGFALNQGYVVTNYHVVENAKTIEIKGVKGDFTIGLKANVVATDKVNDIAILKINDERFSDFGVIPYKIKRTMSDVGETVWALGYPMIGMMGEEIKFTDGKISARTGLQGDMSTYQISVPLQPGNSGGPLFDNNGNIVGINSSGINKLYSEQTIQTENVNYAIKTSYLYNVVESAISTSILPQGTALQGKPLTEKIKLSQKFVFLIRCYDYDKNDHNIMNSSISSVVDTSKVHVESIGEVSHTRQPCSKSRPFVVNNPRYLARSGKISIKKITVDTTCTVFECYWKNTIYNINGRYSIKKGTYLLTNTNHKCNFIQGKNIAIAPNETPLPYGHEAYFNLVFEPLPEGTEWVQLIEPDGWFYDNILICE